LFLSFVLFLVSFVSRTSTQHTTSSSLFCFIIVLCIRALVWLLESGFLYFFEPQIFNLYYVSTIAGDHRFIKDFHIDKKRKRRDVEFSMSRRGSNCPPQGETSCSNCHCCILDDPESRKRIYNSAMWELNGIYSIVFYCKYEEV